MTAFAVVNPQSAGGATGRAMAAIGESLTAALGKVIVASTRKQGDATALVARALEQGYRRIVAIGGDGTLNEAVNGLFAAGPPPPDAVFSFAMSGSGGDFRRNFPGEGDVHAQIAALKAAAPRKIDLGRVSFLDESGATQTKFFLNIASFGLSGDVVERVNRARLTRGLGPSVFRLHSLAAALAFTPWRVEIAFDDGPGEDVAISTVAVCNGGWFGGGMKIAPDADIADGLFDVVIVGATGRREMLAKLADIRTGAHLAHPNVKVRRARKLVAYPLNRPCPAERDGEGGMNLPATFDILPAALTLAI